MSWLSGERSSSHSMSHLIKLIGPLVQRRAITTPIRLTTAKPRLALISLFTHDELSRPSVLYHIPGLFLTHLITNAFAFEVFSRFRDLVPSLLAPRKIRDTSEPTEEPWQFIFAAVGLTLGLTVLPMIEVAKAKLSLQRTGALWAVPVYEENSEDHPEGEEYQPDDGEPYTLEDIVG